MEKLKDVFESTLDLREYVVGDNVAFKVIDGDDDTGIITKVSGSSYTIKSNLDGKSKKVKAANVLYYMDAGNGLGYGIAGEIDTDAALDGQI